MKADVLASKGVLVSNPDVKKMNAVRWQFEYICMLRKRKQDMVDLSFILTGDAFQELDIEKQLVLVPFGYIVNPEIMDKLSKSKDEESLMAEQDSKFLDDEQYEEMLKKMEKSGHALDDLDELSVVDNQEIKK